MWKLLVLFSGFIITHLVMGAVGPKWVSSWVFLAQIGVLMSSLVDGLLWGSWAQLV